MQPSPDGECSLHREIAHKPQQRNDIRWINKRWNKPTHFCDATETDVKHLDIKGTQMLMG
ncbi:hypothetical protein [Microcoleus sp. D2_18a_D3]|uniref:hypothetical protein n=1 Tax=Microcoleus sp. D2_18a_D3 TaxID=3055330 RepID=UPI002FD1DB07